VLGENGGQARDVALDELRVERDGGEGVFDLMGYAAGYFFPGGLLLGVKELGYVFEDEDVAEVFAVGGGTGFEEGYCGGVGGRAIR